MTTGSKNKYNKEQSKAMGNLAEIFNRVVQSKESREQCKEYIKTWENKIQNKALELTFSALSNTENDTEVKQIEEFKDQLAWLIDFRKTLEKEVKAFQESTKEKLGSIESSYRAAKPGANEKTLPKLAQMLEFKFKLTEDIKLPTGIDKQVVLCVLETHIAPFINTDYIKAQILGESSILYTTSSGEPISE